MDREFKTKQFMFDIKGVDTSTGEFTGWASVFGNVDSDGDIIDKGAFKRTIKNQKVFPLLWSHKMDQQIGFIQVKEKKDKDSDIEGLYAVGKPNLDIERARDARALAQQGQELGAPMGLSVGIWIMNSEWKKEGGIDRRHITEVKLVEVSVVAAPSNDLARIADQKSININKDEQEFIDFVKALSDTGKPTPDPLADVYESASKILKEE